MTNVQLYVSIGVTTVLIRAGLLVNWSATKELAARFSVFEATCDRFTTWLGNWKAELMRLKSSADQATACDVDLPL